MLHCCVSVCLDKLLIEQAGIVPHLPLCGKSFECREETVPRLNSDSSVLYTLSTGWEAGIMDLHYFQSWRVSLLLILMPCGYQCMSVQILDEDPVHVIPGTSLVLKAQINHGPQEEISMVTWERQPETGSPSKKVTVATCPGKNIKCADKLPNAHVSAEQHGTTLKLEGYNPPADSGVYAITVTDQNGVKTTAQCIVREYEPVHHVSVSVNISHSILVCGEAWGTDPQFSWLYERSAISTSVGNVSKDGKTLYVSSAPMCGHFTCMVTNKMGHSVATYTAAPCEAEGKGRDTTAAVVCLVILVACGGVLAFLLWRRRRYSSRGERLHEHLDDTI